MERLGRITTSLPDLPIDRRMTYGAMRRAIIEGRDANILNTIAAQGGMLSLHEDGLRKVAAGHTTLDELARVTQDQSDA